jgi:hypothetical protein
MNDTVDFSQLLAQLVDGLQTTDVVFSMACDRHGNRRNDGTYRVTVASENYPETFWVDFKAPPKAEHLAEVLGCLARKHLRG